MSHVFDLRHVLRGISPSLLGEFFKKRGLPVPSEDPLRNGVPQPYREWIKLPQKVRTEVQVILHQIHSLADHRGIKVMTEEIGRRCPHRSDEFIVQTAHLDKAMWFFLKLPTAFEQAALFAAADALSAGAAAIRRSDLPRRKQVRIRAAKIRLLEKELSNHFSKVELRGQYCRVRHYSRGGKTEYFFAYLDDWPNRRLVFRDDGRMVPRNERFAFQLVFAYCGHDGSLEVLGETRPDTHLPLQQAFCKAILDIPHLDAVNPQKPAYRLDMLLDRGFTFPTDPADNIKQVRLVRVRIHPINARHDLDYIELKFRSHVNQVAWSDAIHRSLDLHGLTAETAVVKQATFQLIIAGMDGGRDKKLSWYVTIPHTCNLKSRPDDLRLIGERCLQLWEIVSG